MFFSGGWRAFRASVEKGWTGRRIGAALLLWSACPAEAAVYKYTFSSSGPATIAGSIELIVSGLTITGVANGTGSLAGASLTGWNLSGSTYYGTAPRLLSTSPSATYFFSNTTEEALGLKVGGSLVALRSSSVIVATDTGTTFIGYPLGEGSVGRAIESQSLAPAPAPLPGAGWLSWLLVAGAAICKKRKLAFSFVVTRFGLLRRKLAGVFRTRTGRTLREEVGAGG